MTVIEAPTTALLPLERRRLAAEDWLAANRFPRRVDEDWRYAPIDRLAALDFRQPFPAPTGVVPAPLPEIGPAHVVIVNGSVTAGPAVLPAGVHILSLSEALADRELAAVLAVSPDEYEHAYQALVDAVADDGVVLVIDTDAVVSEPIHLAHVVAPADDGQAVATRVEILVGAGSKAAVVESRVGAGGHPAGASCWTRIHASRQGHIDHVLVQEAALDQHHLHRLEVDAGEASRVTGFVANLGGATSRTEMIARLDTDSTIDFAGIALGSGRQVHDHQVRVHHLGTGATSSQDFCAVLDDASRSVFGGAVLVAPGADGTDASQSNDNLLLSDRAEADTQPRLEILADDVACRHGATVGQLDDDALYYLRTRGIGAAEARAMLVDGFAHRNLERIPIDAVRRHVDARITELQT